MAIKLIRIAAQQSVLCVNLNHTDPNSKDIWGKCPPEVKSFALQNLKPGDEVDMVSHTEADGLHITQIAKVGTLKPGTPAPAQQAQPPKQEPVSGPATVTQRSNTGKYRDPVTPEEATAMRRASVMASTCNAMVCVQTQVDPNGLADYIISVYRKLLAEVEK